MTSPSMRLWLGLSVLLHLVVAAALFAASLASAPVRSSPKPEGVMMVRLIGDDRGERTARPAEQNVSSPEPSAHPRRIESPHPPLTKGGPEEHSPEVTASVVTFSEAPSAVDGDGASIEEPTGQSGGDAESREEASPEAAGATGVAPEDAYRPVVLAALARAKRYPLLGRQRGIEGVVGIAFTIHPDGHVSAPEVIQSSRSPVLDEAALGMVRRIGTLPPPPSPAPLRFPARIEYRLTAERDVLERAGSSAASSSFSIIHHKESSP